VQTILWRDPKKMLDAAKAMKLSAKDLLELKVIDEIIPEPLGGAHRDRNLILSNVRESISKNLNLFKEMSGEEILDQRKNKFLKIGRNKGFISNPENLSTLESKKNNLEQFYVKNKKIFYFTIAFLLLVAFLVTFFL
jgi:acetyl-CoA carboxylase carboxyl transferase subunit alpha